MNKNFHLSDQEKQQLVAKIPKMAGKKILIIGDIGLDEYVMGDVRRISPEAPVPVLDVENEEYRLGLAANVAQNVVSLGGQAQLVSVIGADTGGELLKDLLRKNGVKVDSLVVDEQRPTTRKMRVMAKHHHLVRVDYEVRKYLNAGTLERLVAKVAELMPSVDGVILQDYAKGVVSEALVKKVVEVAHQHGKKVLADPHRSNPAAFYQGVDLIKPNNDESMAISGLNFDDLREVPDKVLRVGKAIQTQTGAKQVVITRGKEGMTLFSGETIEQVPTFARQVFDVTGAGDTVIAALTMALVSDFSLKDSCTLANFAAGVVVGKVGCVPCSTDELKEYILSESHP